ncbi:MAG TPA: DUF2282 domain-containing protein [Patescibacteria group bacterium]|nr:DUF2282 domain-containing protein [Patescibacteria group bacterium]
MKKQMITAATLAAAISFAANAAIAEDAPTEKCYGIVKAGKNDCHTAAHSCAGSAKTDNDRTEWLKLPKGLCDRITGGSTEAPATEKGGK